MKNILCIGCGTVGYATCLALSSLGHSIIGVDKCLIARNRMIKSGFPCFSLEEIMFDKKHNGLLINVILIALPTPFCLSTNKLSDEYLMSSITLISYLIQNKLEYNRFSLLFIQLFQWVLVKNLLML